MIDDDVTRLAVWFQQQLPDVHDLRIDGIDRIEFGYSAEMLALTLVWTADGQPQNRDIVVRLRPAPPGLLEPYDLRRQFDILTALENTSVRSPRALWIEESGDVLGRPFYVMERLPGVVYERDVPPDLAASPSRIHDMAERIIEQIAAIHLVDLHTSGLDSLDSGNDYMDRELDHWQAEMLRVQREPLPSLERLAEVLRAQCPGPGPGVTLVHGDPKAGNFAFVDDQVSAVFDWEMAELGDPMADIGWVEVTWQITPPFSQLTSGDLDELLTGYEQLTGFRLHDRSWHRAMQAFKMAVILLIGAMLVDSGSSDDLRLAAMGQAVPYITGLGLRALGVDDDLESGPVTARSDRVSELRNAPQS